MKTIDITPTGRGTNLIYLHVLGSWGGFIREDVWNREELNPLLKSGYDLWEEAVTAMRNAGLKVTDADKKRLAKAVIKYLGLN